MDTKLRALLLQSVTWLDEWFLSWSDEPAPNRTPLQMVQFLERVVPMASIWRRVEANRPRIMAQSLRQSPSRPPETTKRLEAKCRTQDSTCALQFDQFLPGKGRSVLAARAIEPDESLFQDQPASIVLYPECIPARCSWCYRAVPTERQWPCHNCTDAVYCDPTCAAMDWSWSHRFDCGVMKYWWRRNANMGHIFHWLNRIGVKPTLAELNRRSTEPNDPANTNDDDLVKFRRLLDLIEHTAELTNEEQVKYAIDAIECAILACLAQDIDLTDLTPEQFMDLVLHCHLSLARMMVNTFTWSEHGATTGSCLYLFASQFNHSCQPTCGWRVSDGQWHLTSANKVSPGSELTISYGACAAHEVTFRRDYLHQHYHFWCQCRPCKKALRRL